MFAVGDPIHVDLTALQALVRICCESFRWVRGSRPSQTVQLSERPNHHCGLGNRAGGTRGYQSRAPVAGTVDFYERPDGIEDQARYICQELVPGVLERIDGATLGDVAVLYLDKTDGDVIATAAAAQGLEYMRVDRGGPYHGHRPSRWLEDCARWCAGGWRTAEPRLAD